MTLLTVPQDYSKLPSGTVVKLYTSIYVSTKFIYTYLHTHTHIHLHICILQSDQYIFIIPPNTFDSVREHCIPYIFVFS